MDPTAAVAAYAAGSLGYSINAQGFLLFYVLGAVKVRSHQHCCAAAWPGRHWMHCWVHKKPSNVADAMTTAPLLILINHVHSMYYLWQLVAQVPWIQ